MAGDRFILLNSVAVVSVVFCCDNGCEYKIGGNFVILGEEGYNFSIIDFRLHWDRLSHYRHWEQPSTIFGKNILY